MKKYISFIAQFGGYSVLLATVLILWSCEGPMGPQGLAGLDGENGIDGVDGTDGTNGVAGNAVCLTCHTSAVKGAVTAQYETSVHAIGAYVGYAGARNDCAKCHSHEGFVETVWTGLDTTAANIPLPQPVQCKTCHSFHYSLDFENESNSAIRKMDAVTLMAGGEVVEFANTESNLCMNCHQSRRNPADDADGAAMVYVSPHYGPHHGPQANMINGLGGYEFRAGLSTTMAHESMSNCVYCHMPSGGTGTGGHTWVPGIEGCTACHSGATDFDINGVETEIQGLIADLEAALITAGMLDAEGHAIESVSYQADSVGALWNFLLVEEDASHGIHNPAYAKALLTESIGIFN